MAESHCIKIPPETEILVLKAIENANRRLEGPTGVFCTHGPLTLRNLVGMLLEDVAATQGRPDGWEADNMTELLLRKGYDVTEKF